MIERQQMIYTVTFNSSIDYVISVNEFKTGVTNRVCKELIYPGGKGINVSIALSNLGLDNVALGFYAGFTGEKIIDLLNKANVKNKFIKVFEGNSRINVKCRNFNQDGSIIDETEINGIGPKIGEAELDEFSSQIDALQDGDFLVLSGSVPPTLPNTIYKDITKRLKNTNVKVVVDATKNLMLNVLEYKPFLVKPNKHELEEIFEVDINNDNLEEYAKKLQNSGAVNVLVSNGGDVALFLDEQGNVFKSNVPNGDVKNSVGAGDSMVAGFLYGYFETNNYEQAFKYSLAAGSACAFSENFALKNDVINLYNQL